MQFKKSELKNLIKEEVLRKKQVEDLQAKKTKLSEELAAVMKECGMDMEEETQCEECNMEEHGDGIGMGLELNRPKTNEEERLAETKPSTGLSAKKRSSVVKAARAGKDIGKKGKGFKDVVANAKGARDPQAVAAAAMWNNIPR
jgi:hypothetical protein